MKKVHRAPPGRAPRPHVDAIPVRQFGGNRPAPRAALQGNGWMLLSLLLMGVFTATVAFPSFVILACGLPPAAVSGVINNRRGREMFACMLAANLSGIAPALVRLWSGGNTLSVAMTLLTDPYVWLAMYGAAAVGWALLWIFPVGVDVSLALIENERVRQLRNYQKKLVTEWGPEVAGVAGQDLPAPRAAGNVKARGARRDTVRFAR